MLLRPQGLNSRLNGASQITFGRKLAAELKPLRDGDGISGRVAFQMQFADGIMNTPVAR